MTRTMLRSSLTAFLLIAALVGVSPSSASETSAPLDGAPVYVDGTSILLLESFPVQVQLVVEGSVPTPCHVPQWTVDQRDDGIDVSLWSEAPPRQDCATVLEPVRVVIPLGSFEHADMPVRLDGEIIGQLIIGAPSPGDPVALVGAGWSFGMCAGYCAADLAIDGAEIVLTGSGPMLEEPVFANHGVLTATGQAQLAAATDALDDVMLELVYGCPDCADGGAASVTLTRGGVTTRHEMEFARPPEVLARVYELSMAMSRALESCRSTALVEVAPDCQPYEA